MQQSLFTHQSDQETKEMRQKCISLFESGIEENQKLAFHLSKTAGITKFDLIWGYIIKKLDKKEIIAKWAKAYEDGEKFVILLSFNFMREIYYLIDYRECDVSIINSDNYTNCTKLAEWGDFAIDKMYPKIYKALKKYCLTHLVNINF